MYISTDTRRAFDGESVFFTEQQLNPVIHIFESDAAMPIRFGVRFDIIEGAENQPSAEVFEGLFVHSYAVVAHGNEQPVSGNDNANV